MAGLVNCAAFEFLSSAVSGILLEHPTPRVRLPSEERPLISAEFPFWAWWSSPYVQSHLLGITGPTCVYRLRDVGDGDEIRSCQLQALILSGGWSRLHLAWPGGRPG